MQPTMDNYYYNRMNVNYYDPAGLGSNSIYYAPVFQGASTTNLLQQHEWRPEYAFPQQQRAPSSSAIHYQHGGGQQVSPPPR